MSLIASSRDCGASVFSEQAEGLDWYRGWRERHGRALRVLHLGNIANNAFNNARIQRQQGIEAYVIAYENYHIMSCPEWEEATFEGDLGNPFFPDWSKVDLGSYQRPDWFASGPLELCCSMIAAQITNQIEQAGKIRRTLEQKRKLASSRSLRSQVMSAGGKVKRAIRRVLSSSVADHARLAAICKVGNGGCSPLKRRDFAAYRSRLAPLAKLFDHFDVIQAYSIDGAWPLLARRPYIAYEHGTLRAIPFQNNRIGRLASTVFLGANHVFVTNIDCIAAARRLGISGDRVTPLPHAFDDKKLVAFKKQNGEIKPPADRVLFFHPARHDWRDADPSLVKGNDRLIRAFASVSREHPRSRLAMIAWGRDLDTSRELVRSFGIDDKVQWLAPMRKPELWRKYLSSHAVLDQFVLPCFGGITFEALALGRRVITNVDFTAAEKFFSKAPPIMSASTEREIAEALCQVIADQVDRRGVGETGSAWIQRYHSAERIVELQLQAYQQHIEPIDRFLTATL
ncbi:glycosyltransferase family 4 protein [Bradyrhizobium jicamae]|uniref:glycosyltransferase family 4 protein n=1 Tax=Bradyrhizobium jicamae TaxID=280332 RepID=UPI001BA646C6|nr:glycosyltransferase family 4 protein [Bradyrhizobium jicamae]MBR0938038.1 glycosyltransferase family 4 protein [Bradyrhizobium jicamae]